jgi:hypothetical protein
VTAVQALQFWRTAVADDSGFLEAFIDCLTAHGIRYCIIGGQGVNAYVEPLVSLDLDVVVAAEQLEGLEALLEATFVVHRFPHSLNVSLPDSDLRVQIQTDTRYAPFVARATEREVLGLKLPVAEIGDLLQGKVWAVEDSTRRASKRQKDLADILRLIEAHPELRDRVPPEILDRLYQ